MALSIIASADSADFTGARSTYNFALNAVGADFLLVGFRFNSSTVVPNSITHGVTGAQVVLTLADSYMVGTESLYIYKTHTPSQDPAAVVTITLSASVMGTGGAIAFAGVDSSTPLGTATKSTGSAGNNVYPAGVVSSASGEIVVDFLGCYGGMSAVAATEPVVGAGQTERIRADNNHASVQSLAGGMVGSTEAGAASVTMSWAASSPGLWNGSWSQWAAAVKPAGATVATVQHRFFSVLTDI